MVCAETSGQVLAKCSDGIEIHDLANLSLRAICTKLNAKGMRCEIRESKIHNVGLFNGSTRTFTTNTVFQVLSYGPLYEGIPVTPHVRCGVLSLCALLARVRSV